jgi:hypothetical protein
MAHIKQKRGSILAECAIAIGMLVAVAGTLSVLAGGLSRARTKLRETTSRRLVIESTGERLLAMDYEAVDDAAKVYEGEYRLVITVESLEMQGVAGKRVTIRAVGGKLEPLTLWRFPSVLKAETNEDV